MVLVRNWPFFHFLFKGIIGEEIVFYVILDRKNAFLGYKKKKVKKSKNCHFSKGFWSKIGHFSKFFLKAKKAKENESYDILEKKNSILGYKNKKFKKWKNCHFSKGVSPCFW